jgi:hypothetical protein
MTTSSHSRTIALIAITGCAILVSAAPARAGGGDLRDAVSARGGDGRAATIRHRDRASIVPAGLAGAPLLTEWWREPFSKSADDPTNPFGSGGCRTAAHAIALAYPGGRCMVRQGTSIFAVGFSVECSNVEADPFHADTPLEAARCGLRWSRVATEATLTVDGGEPVSVLNARFGTFMLPGRVIIPENPLAGGTPGEIMRYGGYGYVAFIPPLPVGEHTLHTHFAIGAEVGDFDTTITVTR